MISGKKTKFDSLVTGKSTLLEEIRFRKENEAWLDESAKIAILVLSELRKKNLTQADLALEMGVSAQYISKIVKGQENLTLDTICKLQNALGVKIIAEKCIHSWELVIPKKHYEAVVKMAALKSAVNEPRIRGLIKSAPVTSRNTGLSVPLNAENLYEQEVTE